MGDLFANWRDRIDVNSERAVDLYVRELADFRRISVNARARAAMLDFAVFLRRRTIALVAEDLPFTDEDLSFIAAVGSERATRGVSFLAHRDVLRLHHSLILREVDEAAGQHDLDDVMRALTWWPTQGLAAPAAYTRGYLLGQSTVMPEVNRVWQLTNLLVTDDPAAAELAGILAVPVPEPAMVVVCRVPVGSRLPDGRTRADVSRDLLSRQRIPLWWAEPGEFVAVVADAAAAERVVRDFAESTGLPAAVGASWVVGAGTGAAGAGWSGAAATRAGVTGPEVAGVGVATAGMAGAQPTGAGLAEAQPTGAGLAEAQPTGAGLAGAQAAGAGMAAAFARAKEISRVAPVHAAPAAVHHLADLFAEVGAIRLAPVDGWLREVTGRLATGPQLISTLDALYRNDMSRSRTAASLHVHPRTLDYRLRRVRDLTGLDPVSVHGIRVLSTAVNRALAELI